MVEQSELAALQLLDEPFALLAPGSLDVRFGNDSFWAWLGHAPMSGPVTALLAGLDVATVNFRLDEDCLYVLATERAARQTSHRHAVEYEFRPVRFADTLHIAVHGRSCQRLREAQALLRAGTTLLDAEVRKLGRHAADLEELVGDVARLAAQPQRGALMLDPDFAPIGGVSSRMQEALGDVATTGVPWQALASKNADVCSSSDELIRDVRRKLDAGTPVTLRGLDVGGSALTFLPVGTGRYVLILVAA